MTRWPHASPIRRLLRKGTARTAYEDFLGHPILPLAKPILSRRKKEPYLHSKAEGLHHKYVKEMVVLTASVPRNSKKLYPHLDSTHHCPPLDVKLRPLTTSFQESMAIAPPLHEKIIHEATFVPGQSMPLPSSIGMGPTDNQRSPQS